MNLNSALYWLPRIEKAGLSVPRTIVVPYNHSAAIAAMENQQPYDPPWRELEKAFEGLGGGMAFLRTDQASAKHDGPKGYFVCGGATLRSCFWKTVEFNEMALFMEGPHGAPEAILLREWLDLAGNFHNHGLLIAQEYRLFVVGAHVRCAHFYWPEEAIQNADCDDWKNRLRRTKIEARKALDWTVDQAARKAAEVCADHPAWSVDFARDTSGKWWLIDMAIAERSWHPPCKYNPRVKGRKS